MKKRAIGVVLAVCMAATLFTGCGSSKKKEESVIDQASRIDKEHVYKLEPLEIEGLTDKNVSGIFGVGDRIYMRAFPESGSESTLFSFKQDYSDVKSMKLPAVDGESYSYLNADLDGNVYAIFYKYDWGDGEDVIFEDGGMAEEGTEGMMNEAEAGDAGEGSSDALDTQDASDSETSEASEEVAAEDQDAGANEYTSSGEETCLIKLDKDGKVVYKIDLISELGQDGYVSINSMSVTDDGMPIISVDQGLVTYDENSGFKYLIDNRGKQETYYNLVKSYNGNFYVYYYGEKGVEFCSLDIATGKVGSPSAAILDSNGGYSFFGGNGYDLYYSDDKFIYGFDQASDSLTKLMNLMDSDLTGYDSINNAFAISDKEIIAAIPDMDYNLKLYKMTKVAPQDVKDKKVITLAGYYIPYYARKMAFDFNSKNDEYKIKFVDYSEYNTEDDYGAGAEKLNLDIVSGNVPDIILIDENLPVESYINKGLFADLNSYFANDPELSNTKFLDNIVDAFMTDGKRYQVVPSFEVFTMAVKSKYVDGRNTISFKECEDLIKKAGISKDKAFGFTTRDEFLEECLKYSGSSYIDWENKKCDFAGEGFINLIEFSNNFVKEYSEADWEDWKDTMYLEDDALFGTWYISRMDDFTYLKHVRFGTDISLVGYPNDYGQNNSIIIPTLRMAISSQSKYKDVAFDYVKSFLSEEYQDETSDGFPVRESSFNKRVEESQERPYNMEDGKKVYYDNTVWLGGQEVIVDPLTKAEAEEYSNFIRSLDKVVTYNKGVSNIITEEISAYYSGQKSAEEVANIIQSRLSIYVNENS